MRLATRTIFLISVLLVAIGLLAISTLPGSGATCEKRSAIASELERKFGERMYIGALSKNSDALIEFWGSTETGTWTALRTMPNGMACVLGTGDQFWFKAEGTVGQL